MLGPEGFGGLHGDTGQITAIGGAKVAIIARWSIRRVGTNPPTPLNPQPTPRLRFRAHFSWKNDVLMSMCQKGQLKGRVTVFMQTVKGKEQVDIVNWDEWRVDADGALTLENVMHFGVEPLKKTII